MRYLYYPPVGVARAVAVRVVRRGICAAGRGAPGQGPRGIRIGSGARVTAVMMDHGRRATGRRRNGRRRREFEHRGRRGDRATA